MWPRTVAWVLVEKLRKFLPCPSFFSTLLVSFSTLLVSFHHHPASLFRQPASPFLRSSSLYLHARRLFLHLLVLLSALLVYVSTPPISYRYHTLFSQSSVSPLQVYFSLYWTNLLAVSCEHRKTKIPVPARVWPMVWDREITPVSKQELSLSSCTVVSVREDDILPFLPVFFACMHRWTSLNKI
jgi:hypothetical protein